MRRGTFYYSTDHYCISFNKKNDWLEVDWLGFQPNQSVPKGCELVLKALSNLKLSKVLNSNTQVKGLWNAQWVAFDWFPRMQEAGLTHFAWVISPEPLCAGVANNVINITPAIKLIKIKTFRTTQEAEDWLKTI